MTTPYPDSSAGHTVLESAVALALLLAVLVPLSHGVYALAQDRRHQELAEALALGQQALEDALHTQAYTPERWWTPRRRWRLLRNVYRDGPRIRITVEVHRGDALTPTLTLTTLRLDDDTP